MLKSELINLVLGFQSQDLIISILTETLSIISSSVKFLNVINSFPNFAVIAPIHSALVLKLLPPSVNVFSQTLVLRGEIT